MDNKKNTLPDNDYLCCIQGKTTTSRESEMTEMQAHRGDGTVLRRNFSAFFLRSAWVKIFPPLYIFRTPTQSSWSHFLPTCCTSTCILPGMLSTQLTRRFCRADTCILFTRGNRYTSGCVSTSSAQPFQHATHITYAAFPSGHLRLSYFRKHFYFLL